MRLPISLIPLLSLLSPILAHPLNPRSVPFTSLSGLTTLSHDLSTSDPRHPDKYFHEYLLHPHYDGRFSISILPPTTRLFHMRLLLATYMRVMARAHVDTWIAHGTLLGWWWNGKIMRWDSDIDVQVSESGIAELGGWWNMSVHSFSAAELGLVDDRDAVGDGGREVAEHRVQSADAVADLSYRPEGVGDGVWERVVMDGKKYLLEVNPRFGNTSTADKRNVIDARWIDVATGLFIDITAVHPVPDARAVAPSVPFTFDEDDDDGDEEEVPPQMFSKDKHLYPRSALFPLRTTTFEGVDVRVPFAYEALLVDEYGPLALTQTWYRGYVFEGGEWEPAPQDG